MPVPTASFLVGLIVLGYLFTFIVFAILRVLTGISIQRVGYSGFRRIAFSPRHGIKITIRGVGLSPHRPTFALPTWCSLVITELCITVDIKALEDGKKARSEGFKHTNGSAGKKSNGSVDGPADVDRNDEGHGKLWRDLTEIKEKIKRLHGKIHWLRLIDLIADAAEVNIVGVGSLRIERATLSVDTRSQTVDRSRLFQHHQSKPESQRPAEWKSIVRSVLFTPEGRESSEVLDYFALNIHGLLHRELQGLRDASITFKLGRLNVPYDDIEHAKKSADLIRGRYAQPHEANSKDVSLSDALDEMEQPGSREERIVQTVSDSRAFISSILRGIHEVQVAVGFLGFSKKLSVKADSGASVYFNLAMKEVGMDILRLDSKTPAHRMYFSREDVAHQGLLTAISIAAGIDDGHERPERMVYVPMITATVKTTLPARTLHYSKNDSAGERNSNLLYANFVCTSPSIDLDPKHLPLVLQMANKQKSATSNQPRKSNSHRIISQLLPKASVKLSIQEPVIRVSLPPMDKQAAPEDYDLLISSVSSMSLEVESSHSSDDQLHYSLASSYRHTSHQLYYQTAASERHDLMHSDTVEFKVDMNAIPGATVTAFGRFQTLTIYLVRPDICEGVRQIVKQLRNNVLKSHKGEEKPQASFLRGLPPWLQQFRLEGHEFGLQLAGVDDKVSEDTRGFALELETWTVDYKANRDDAPHIDHRRRSSSRASMSLDKPPQSSAGTASPRKKKQNATDGRRLTVHVQNLDGLIIDSIEGSQPDPFMSLPRFEAAFSTSTDAHGPIFHINSHAKSLLLHYSLYNHFAIGMAFMVVKRTFLDHGGQRAKAPTQRPPMPEKRSSLQVPGSYTSADEVAKREITTIDFKASLIQIKATLPADPPMMLQIFGLEAGQHRWASAFFRNKLTRLYVRAPSTKSAWSRIVSIKAPRLDLRDIKRKQGSKVITEKSVDLATDSIRIGVPHQLLVHSIFDNVTNIIKTSKQLQHHFATGTMDDILTKEPEGPKNVPRVSLRTQLFVFEVEDSSFEWKLGAIYRAGLLEQKQRLARDELFEAKAKKIRRGARNESRRARSTHPASRSRSTTRIDETTKRSRSEHPTPELGEQRTGRRRMRYDTEGKCGISDTSALTIEQAQDRLHRLNADTWKARIDRVLNFQKRTMKDLRAQFWGIDEIPDDVEQHEPIIALTQRPALLAIHMSNLAITIDKPSFPVEECPKFLHEIGKGMPYDMQYGLLVPMNLHVTTGEAKCQLRDYPLPLLHVPALANGQSPRLPSLSLRTDFVIAEEFRDLESQKEVTIVVVPKEKMGHGRDENFSFNVRRTISPVKTYSDMKFEIHTSLPTKITWGTSFQPAIQDAMQCIEGFTKPPIDTSDRVGFWDKIRLSFHSRINVAWKGDGDFHLILKGSRDPYVVTGDGAGLVMVWRNDVRWNIAQHEDPRQFMTVDSGDYLLAVPDFNKYARYATEHDLGDDSSSGSSSVHKRDAIFKKVIMKLSGQVRWMAGLMFERDLPNGSRSFDFKPHYDVVLKHPDFAKAPPGGEYDAFRDFRSHHIHMSIAIAAPHSRDWSVSNLKPSKNYNSLHLTPRFFSHFFSWWSMFSGVMSLPVRQGPLWGMTQKKSKKFGRHIATIKYNLLLSPLFVSHIYKHKDAEEYADDGTVSATGLKMKLDSFMLDLHQRREFFDIKGHDDAAAKRSSGMRINQTQVDFIAADLRAISASITGTSAKEMEKATDETLAGFQGHPPQVNLSKFTIPDNDFTWIDMDDFVELDWILPAESDPETKILPLGYAPRFTYFRQTDHGDSISGDTTRSSPFGDEPTHYCVISGKNDPRRVQAELIGNRLQALKAQRESNVKAENDQELKMVKSLESDVHAAEAKMEAIRLHGEQLLKKEHFLRQMLETLIDRLEHDDPAAVPELETADEFYEAYESTPTPMAAPDKAHLDSAPLADYTSDFNNRFIVHNPQIKWNNSLRNIILRYIHQNSQRRGFVYYMSQRAVKFIVDILEEQKKKDTTSSPNREKSWTASQGPGSPDVDDDVTVQDRIEQLLRDGRDYVNADDPNTDEDKDKAGGNGPTDEISHEFTPLNTYHFRLIAPQIQLHSEKNPKSAVLVTAKGMQLKVVQIMDKDRVNDEVSGLVQRRFTAAMDSLQMFVTSTKTFSTEYLRMYSGNRYGVKAGTCWPPWVPLEIMFEFEDNPYGFNRVVHRTSASLRYDKYNTLRLKYNDDVSGGDSRAAKNDDETENRMDHVWLEFPQFRAICDSTQYFALYIIVMDLLLYSEPLEKTRSERLEKIMLASDFSDLTGAPEMVQMLQGRIRQLEEIKLQFQVQEKYLDRQGWKDRITMDQDLASCEDELFFMMKAITTAQQRLEDRRDQENAAGLLHLNMSAKEIAWHLIRDKGESLVELQLKNASFDRTDNNDGSNYNCMQIGRINGLNLLPDAIYPEIIGPYIDPVRGFHEPGSANMLRIQWLMLDAIAGIPVVDYFEVDLVPLKMQLERDIAKKLFEYIFPGEGGNAFDGTGFSPFLVRNMLPPQEEDDDAMSEVATPDIPADPNHETQTANSEGTGAGSLERRLVPTLYLPKQKKAKVEKDPRGLGISSSSHHNLHGFGLFQHSDKNRHQLQRSAASKAALSNANLSPAMIRSPSQRSVNTMRSEAQSVETEKTKRFASSRHSGESKRKAEKRGDDLTEMMNRASNYMTLAFVKIPSMVLCLSYKGKGHRNIEDVHNLVFRMPTLEYRNKTWSNLDLALQLKKDVIKALISHAGAIVGNKFSNHKPSRQQISRLREIANMSTLLKDSSSAHLSSGSASTRESELDYPNGRPSTASARPSTLSRSVSFNSTPSISGEEASDRAADKRPATSGASPEEIAENADASPQQQQRHLEPQDASSSHRSRTASLSRRLTGGFANQRASRRGSNGTSASASKDGKDGDDTAEENSRKSKLLLGGQKLLRSLRD